METFPQLSSGSMKVQSPLTGSAIAMYPASLSNAWVTRVIKFLGDQEQRWVVRRPLFSATLQYHSMNGYDTSLLSSFFSSVTGKYVLPDLSNSFSITLGSETYDYCVFDQDEFNVTCNASDSYSFSLKITQLRPNT